MPLLKGCACREQRHPSPINSSVSWALEVSFCWHQNKSLDDFGLWIVIGLTGCPRGQQPQLYFQQGVLCPPSDASSSTHRAPKWTQCSGIWFMPIFMSKSLFHLSVVWRVPWVPARYCLGQQVPPRGPCDCHLGLAGAGQPRPSATHWGLHQPLSSPGTAGSGKGEARSTWKGQKRRSGWSWHSVSFLSVIPIGNGQELFLGHKVSAVGWLGAGCGQSWEGGASTQTGCCQLPFEIPCLEKLPFFLARAQWLSTKKTLSLSCLWTNHMLLPVFRWGKLASWQSLNLSLKRWTQAGTEG